MDQRSRAAGRAEFGPQFLSQLRRRDCPRPHSRLMKNLNWFQGRDLAISENRAIRREAWRKWLVFGPALRFISKIVDDVEQRYVVPNFEFGRDEFLANDWTDEPWVDG